MKMGALLSKQIFEKTTITKSVVPFVVMAEVKTITRFTVSCDNSVLTLSDDYLGGQAAIAP